MYAKFLQATRSFLCHWLVPQIRELHEHTFSLLSGDAVHSFSYSGTKQDRNSTTSNFSRLSRSKIVPWGSVVYVMSLLSFLGLAGTHKRSTHTTLLYGAHLMQKL